MNFKLFMMLMTVLAFGATVPAHADKGGKGKGHGASTAQESRHDHGNNDDDTVFGFNDKEAAVIIGVLRSLYGGEDGNVEIVRPSREFCPPGLAKKNNGCMPPGLAKKYSVGQRLPDDVIARELPDVLRDALGLPPRGKKYVQVDNDVLLIQEGTRLILDAIGLGS